MSMAIDLNNENPIRRAVELSGGVAKFAKAVGVGRTSVHNWLTHKKTPQPKHCLRIQKLTNGMVRPEDIYQDLYKNIE